MSLKLKILYLLEEMGGLCLDNEEERMEVASRLASGLCPPAAAEADEGNVDELIEELVDSDPLDWDHVNGERSLTIGSARVSLRNFGSSSDVELFVCGKPMLLKPHQKMELFKMCHRLRACEQRQAIAKAVCELRRRKFGEI